MNSGYYIVFECDSYMDLLDVWVAMELPVVCNRYTLLNFNNTYYFNSLGERLGSEC